MAEHDLTMVTEDGIVNVRVGAIIIKNGCVLMAGNSNVDHLYTVGGRVKFGESTEEAVMREVEEETGVRLTIDRLGFVHEVFFKLDAPQNFDVPQPTGVVYEISFFFYMNVPEDFEPVSMDFAEGEDTEHLVWMPIGSEAKYYPEFFRTELQDPSQELRHIVTREF